MVFYFKSNVVDPPAFIYMGKDKEERSYKIWMGPRCLVGAKDENIRLLKLTLKCRFHVDNLSSAHVYVRLNEGDSWTNIPEPLLIDCAQLTKANSIEGNKKDNIIVIYTPWSNLRKDASMATGQVSFHDPKQVKKRFVTVRENAIVNRLNKTKDEKNPDLRAEKDAVQREQRKKERLDREKQKQKDRDEKAEREALKWQRDHAYDEWTDSNAMRSNDQDFDPEEDFM